MILDANQLAAVRQRNDEKLRQGCGRGYPAHTILDLLHTVEALKQEKRKWKKLAQERGRALGRIAELAAATGAGGGAAGGDGEESEGAPAPFPQS